MSTTPCPSCGSVDGNTRWGHKVPGVYDGVLFWSCAACSHVWPRTFPASPGLQRQSDEHVERLRSSIGMVLDSDRAVGRAGHDG